MESRSRSRNGPAFTLIVQGKIIPPRQRCWTCSQKGECRRDNSDSDGDAGTKYGGPGSGDLGCSSTTVISLNDEDEVGPTQPQPAEVTPTTVKVEKQVAPPTKKRRKARSMTTIRRERKESPVAVPGGSTLYCAKCGNFKQISMPPLSE